MFWNRSDEEREEREHRKVWKLTCRQRQEKELALFAEIIRLVQTHSDKDGVMTDEAAPLLLSVVEEARGVELENRVMGIWDGAKKPKWYDNLGVTVRVFETDDDE